MNEQLNTHIFIKYFSKYKDKKLSLCSIKGYLKEFNRCKNCNIKINDVIYKLMLKNYKIENKCIYNICFDYDRLMQLYLYTEYGPLGIDE